MAWAAALALVAIFNGALALYSSTSGVVTLTPENFNKRVLNSNGVWVVEFYAPWCGHCQHLAPTYEKVAKALKGVAGVGAVDLEQHRDLGAPYNIQGFPTIKIFGANKQQPIDYKGDRSGKDIVEAVLREVRGTVMGRLGGGGSHAGGQSGSKNGPVVELTGQNFKEMVLDSKETWMVEFYAPWCGHCKNLKPHWTEAARQLKDKVKFGVVDATVHTSLAARYGVQGYPTIKAFGADKAVADDYGGAPDTASLVSFATELAERNAAAPEVLEVTGEDVWESECAAKGRICIVSVLPHILDSSAEERNRQLEMLRALAKTNKARSFHWLWTDAGKQAEMEEALGIGGAGYPAMAAVSVGKAVLGNMRGAYDQTHIQLYLTGLVTGSEPLAPLTRPVKIATVLPWDGKDGEPPVERDEL